jgi:ABC-2 type transport system ATP-binding protein
MTETWAVQTTGLTKSFGELTVLSGVDLRVPPGTVFSLLGPNGAGKTTMVRILSTLVRADSGTARVAGFDVVRQRREVQRRISLTGQDVAVDGLQTGAENLRMMARLRGESRAGARRRAGELLDQFDLAAAGRRRVATYSGGMRRRLDLALGLVGTPSVIFLDEPTTGLDLPSRQTMWGIIKGLVGDGVTVFLTTQYLEEADLLADQIAVVDGGRLVAEGSPAQLKARVAEQRLDLTLSSRAGYGAVEARLGDRVVRRDPDGLGLGVATDGSAAHIRSVLDQVDPDRDAVATFAVHTATLDDVFLALTGGPASTIKELETTNV